MRDKQKSLFHQIVNGIKKFYSTRVVLKIFLTLICVVAISIFLWLIPSFKIRSEKVAKNDYTPKSEVLNKIEKGQGEIIVAEDSEKQLLFHTDDMIVTVKDKGTGKEWSSALKNTTSGTETALVSVTYLGKDNSLSEWNSYDNCTVFDSYELYQIENGIQLLLNLNEGESNRFYEFLPKKMSYENYENIFLQGIEDLVASGELTETAGNRYKQTLSLVYKKSAVDECYAVSYAGSPPINAVTQLITLADLVGYNRDLLLEDAEEYNFLVSFVEPAVLEMVLELTLEDGELIAHIPGSELVTFNDFYQIQNIKVLPNFGAASVTEYEDGYIFVPDGSGALMEFNSYIANLKDYVRPVYDNDFYSDYYFMPEYSQELMMPVYGMMYGAGTHGFLAIIDKGAETSYIHTKLASNILTNGILYNKVYASFDTIQYSNVKVYGPYSEESAMYLVDTGILDSDYTIRYILYEDEVTYFDMVESYRNYLIAQSDGKLNESFDDKEASIYLEVLGSLTFTKRLLGIPYDSTTSMTEYTELLEIMEDLKDTDLMVQYNGVYNKGMDNSIHNTADLVKENGNNKEFDKLVSYVKENNIDLFLNVNFTRVAKKGSGYIPGTHALKDYTDNEAYVYGYISELGLFSSFSPTYSIVSPKYLTGIINGFLKADKDNLPLSISDMGNMFYADYTNKSMISAYTTNKIINENLEKLSDNRKLSLYNPLMKNIPHGAVMTEIKRESSEYLAFTYSIPFRQLVMNGLVQYTSESINMSSKGLEYYILQAAELCVIPKFTISAKSVDLLKNTIYSFYYSTEYQKWSEKIKDIYEECRTLSEKIGTNQITGHSYLDDGVYMTNYASGVSVIVNYNKSAVILEDGSKLSAMSYILYEGGGGR